MTESVFLAIAAFASTNIDDAFVLLAFFSDPRLRTAPIIIGQYIGMTTLVAIALGVAFLALTFPSAYVGYLGVLPILIGIKRFVTAIRERGNNPESQPHFEAHGRAIASVATVTIANGGDNVGTYAPLLARQDPPTILVMCVVFALMTGVWCVAGKLLVSHPALGRHIRQWGHRVVPFVLVAIGGYVLVRSR